MAQSNEKLQLSEVVSFIYFKRICTSALLTVNIYLIFIKLSSWHIIDSWKI